MTSEQAEKRVTWAELFFDLVFAFPRASGSCWRPYGPVPRTC